MLTTRYKQLQLEPRRSDDDMDPGLWGVVPDEIIDRILAFLPLPCFFRLQVVCKRWNSLRFSHGFLEVYSEVVTPRPWLLVFAKGSERPDISHISSVYKMGLLYNFMLKRVSFLYNAESRNWYNLALPCLPPQASILAASGGLLCCEGGMGYFLVCNPVTNTWRPLPPSLLDRNTLQFQMVTDQSTKSYLVIAVGGSFLCPPGKPPSDDYRVRLVLNRLRTSAIGSFSGSPSMNLPFRSYPGFATAHQCRTSLPSSGVRGPRVSTTWSNCERQGGGAPNVLRPAYIPDPGGNNLVREVLAGEERGSVVRAATSEGPTQSATAPDDVPTPAPPGASFTSSVGVWSPSSNIDATSSSASDGLHIATIRRLSTAKRCGSEDNTWGLCSAKVGGGSVESDARLPGLPFGAFDNAPNEVPEQTVSKRKELADIRQSGTQQEDVNSTAVEYKDLVEPGHGLERDATSSPGTSFPSDSSDAGFLLPASPRSRIPICDERIGLAALCTIAAPRGHTWWRQGEPDGSVGLASILDHANLSLSRDSGYHLGQAFSVVRNKLLRSAEASESRHSDDRLGITLNGIRSDAMVPGNARSHSSDHYGFTVEVYDSKIGRWERAGLLPSEVDSISRTAFCNGFLYCLAFNLVQIFRFNMLERSWTSIDIPGPFFFIVPDLVELNGHLVLVGGVKEICNAHCIVIWELDQSKLEWTEVIRMPEELCQEFHRGEHFEVFSCVGNGSLIFFMSKNVPRILVYNFDTQSWDWSPPCHGIENRYQRGFQGFCFQPRLDALV